MKMQMAEIKQEERGGSLLSQYKIIIYIYVRIVELIFIKSVDNTHSALQGQEIGSKFGSISERECDHLRPLCPVLSEFHPDVPSASLLS